MIPIFGNSLSLNVLKPKLTIMVNLEKITLDQGITTIKIHSRKCISGWTIWEKMDTTQPTSQFDGEEIAIMNVFTCLLYTSPSPRDS